MRVAPPTPMMEAEPPSTQTPDALEAYVTAIALNVRSGAGTQNPVVGILLKYDPVTITDRSQVGRTTWYAIDAAGGYVNGWVSGAYLSFASRPSVVFPEVVDYGAPETPTVVRGPFQYVGVTVCKECHEESTGRYPKGAYTVWKDQLHADAWHALSRNYTQVIARRMRGIEDPANDWRCFKCHVTAYGVDASQRAATYRDEDGVGCEVCHGPGSAYAKVDHGPSNPTRYQLGFYKLTNLKEREALCVRCHNTTSPNYKPFNILAFSRAIQHWPDPDDAAYLAHAKEVAREREQVVQQSTRVETSAAPPAPDRETADKARAEAKERERQAMAARAEAERKAQESLERKRAEAKAEAERQAKAASAATASAATAGATGLTRYLAKLMPVFTLNQHGKKYQPVRFSHAAHANKKYVSDIQCQTCHHLQEGDAKPEKCSKCHNVGGDAGETQQRIRAVHVSNKPFPKEPGQEEVSCIGCHKAQNALLEAGQRSGKPAPTKCTACHQKKST
jgi:hypothetical protein